jgi:drug/metabolite transporter (DMT)-like permease
MLIAVLGCLGAALLWAASNLASSRSTRLIGSVSVLAWVMTIGLVLDALFIVGTRTPVTVDRATVGWMAVAGFGNAFGLLFLLSSLRLGKVGLATSITSTEGAVAAVYSVLAGEKLPTTAYPCLALIVFGVVGATLASEQHAIPGERKDPRHRPGDRSCSDLRSEHLRHRIHQH